MVQQDLEKSKKKRIFKLTSVIKETFSTTIIEDDQVNSVMKQFENDDQQTKNST